jgi:MATE family multidrug resistance protein
MLIALVNMGMSITDTVMVSAMFGAEALAAVAIGSDLYSILFYFGAGTLVGLAPFYTAAMVRSDAVERLRLERIGQAAVVILAAALVPIVWTAPDWLGALGIDSALLDQGRGYTRAIALTLAPMLGVALYRAILTAAEQPRVFLRVTLAMLPLNAAANYLLMAGAGPVPTYGATGAGISSFIVAAASLAILLCVARTGARQGESSNAALIDWGGLAAVFRVGLPIGIATVAEVGVFLGATLYSATLGAAAVAAHTLTLRTAGLAYAVPTALLQAAMVRIARAETLADPALRRAVTAGALGLAVIFGAILLAALMVGAAPLANGFFGESDTGVMAAGIAVGLLLLLGVMEFLGTPGSTAAGILRGQKDTRAPMVATLFGHWAVGAPLGLYLCEVQELGITGIWWGLAAGTLVTTVLMVTRLVWRNRNTRASSPYALIS